MAPVAATPGSYFDFEPLANEGAVVVFKTLAFEQDQQMPKGIVKPVTADVLILSGQQRFRLIRGEKIIGAGITSTLRRNELGADVVATMAWGKNGGTSYVQANPPTAEQMARAVEVFVKTNDDPYAAAARAQGTAPAGPVAAAPPAPAPAPPVQAPPAPAPAPAPAAGQPAYAAGSPWATSAEAPTADVAMVGNGQSPW